MQEEISSAEKEEEKIEREESIKSIAYELKGSPYELGPIGEEKGEKLVRKDAFDCTSFVLTVAALYANKEEVKEEMKHINYHPSGEVSYENRLHFSSYRNEVSDRFADITEKVGGNFVVTEEVLLNKHVPGQGRVIDIDWEKKFDLSYIPEEHVLQILDDLPEEVGVGFVGEESFQKGLDITHEGFVFGGEILVHASAKRGEVSEEMFLDYLSDEKHKGVIFYKVES